ncbi:MAG: hypothetical protein J6A16_04035 [Oscillospiraceae bacterium]|nr:hypothetical protein [Oscillospiraceae bacterium]
MKKRIIAALLAAVMVFHIGGEVTRPQAVSAAVGGLGLGILAANLLGLMSGCYDDAAKAIGCLVENGVEGFQKAFVGDADTPSWFVSGWQQIYTSVCDAFDSGDIVDTGGGVYTMKYSVYLAICDQLKGTIPSDLDLGTSLTYKIYDYPHGTSCYASSIPYLDSITGSGVSYVPVLYTEKAIYFCEAYTFYALKMMESSGKYHITNCTYTYSSSYNRNVTGSRFMGGYYADSIMGSFSKYGLRFWYQSNVFSVESEKFDKFDVEVDTWHRWDGASLTTVSPDQIDSGAATGYLISEGYFDEFMDDLSEYSAVVVGDIDDLSEPLDPVLDKTDDPGLIIDTDPDIASPVDATIVTDIPGEADIPLSDLMAKTRLDIDIPSVIATKFPFCIPFDFIRILSVLCADPIAPVFRIPISTDPAQLEQFTGNQTIGQLPDDFVPMFEIDEEIVIDLSCVPLVQPICYTIFIIGFVILLIYITPKMINH